MKKLIVLLAIFIFFRFPLSAQAVGTGFIDKMVKRIDSLPLEKTEVIFSDPSYSKSAHNFFSGQTVYIRVKNAGNGDKQKTLLLLDSAKKEIFALNLNQSGSGPYLFTTTFKAPDKSGIYYVDIKIDSGSGSVYSSQQNINVGELQAQVSISSEAKSEVKGVSTIKPSATPTVISPTATLVPTPETPLPENFVTRFFNFLKKFLNSLTF